MLEDLGPSLKEWFQERGGGTRNAYLGNKGQFLHQLGVLPGADISLSCWPLIPFILLLWDVEVALLWCLVMPSGEVLPPRLSYCPPLTSHIITWSCPPAGLDLCGPSHSVIRADPW